MACWSSGQDDALSRRKPGFDSRTGHSKKITSKTSSGLLFSVSPKEVFYCSFIFFMISNVFHLIFSYSSGSSRANPAVSPKAPCQSGKLPEPPYAAYIPLYLTPYAVLQLHFPGKAGDYRLRVVPAGIHQSMLRQFFPELRRQSMPSHLQSPPLHN